MNPSDFITGPAFAACADVTISPPDVPPVWKSRMEWNPVAFSVERRTRELLVERESIVALRGKRVLFVYADYIDSFFSRIFPYLQSPVIVICHGDARIEAKHFEFLEDEYLFHLFATNCRIIHPKLTPVPIGVPHGQVESLNMVMKRRLAVEDERIYVNFSLHSNPIRQSIHRRLALRDRQTVFDPRKLEPLDYYAEMSVYRFVLSPPGAGPDCFRTWEALYLNRAPIVERWPVGSPYDGIPVFEVEDVGKPSNPVSRLAALETEGWRNRLAMSWWRAQIQQKRSLLT